MSAIEKTHILRGQVSSVTSIIGPSCQRMMVLSVITPSSGLRVAFITDDDVRREMLWRFPCGIEGELVKLTLENRTVQRLESWRVATDEPVTERVREGVPCLA